MISRRWWKSRYANDTQQGRHVIIRRLDLVEFPLVTYLAKFHSDCPQSSRRPGMVFVFLPGILSALKKADVLVFDVMHQEYFLQPDWDSEYWLVFLTGALKIAAGEPDATRPPELRGLELWTMDPTIHHNISPPSSLQGAVKTARSSKEFTFTQADCEAPLPAFVCAADDSSGEMLRSEH